MIVRKKLEPVMVHYHCKTCNMPMMIVERPNDRTYPVLHKHICPGCMQTEFLSDIYPHLEYYDKESNVYIKAIV